MAALDFPNPPLTVGQLYNGTNGVTYQWDGTVWSLPLGGAQLWSVSGAALTPTDATKTIAIPAVALNQITSGGPTVRTTFKLNELGGLALSTNDPWTPQDTTKP